MSTTSTKHLAQAIYESTLDKSGTDLDTVIENSVRLIYSKHLLSKSKEILRNLENIIDTNSHILRARVTSSHFLSKKNLDTVQKELKKRYEVEEVLLETYEDPTLINGIKIEVGDEILDLSLVHQIHQLQDYLLKN